MKKVGTTVPCPACTASLQLQFGLPSVLGQSFVKVHCGACDTEIHMKVRRKRGNPKQIEYSAKYKASPKFKTTEEILNPKPGCLFGVDPDDSKLWKEKGIECPASSPIENAKLQSSLSLATQTKKSQAL